MVTRMREDDGRASAGPDGGPTLARRQAANSHGEDQRVIAGEQEIDQDDGRPRDNDRGIDRQRATL